MLVLYLIETSMTQLQSKNDTFFTSGVSYFHKSIRLNKQESGLAFLRFSIINIKIKIFFIQIRESKMHDKTEFFLVLKFLLIDWMRELYCVKMVRIKSYFGSLFTPIRTENRGLQGKSLYLVQIRCPYFNVFSL